METVDFPGTNAMYGAPSDWRADYECGMLHVMKRDGVCISKWVPTWKERLAILFGRSIYCHMVGERPQPVALTVDH